MLEFVKDLGMKQESGTTRRWCLAKCSYCQTINEVRTQDLKTRKSCGCATHLKANIKHDMSHSRIYQTWADMKTRCLSSTNKRYHRYGGRGITVCEQWLEFTPFKDWALANGYTDELTIDRVDNNGNYCPENCEWITIQENLQRRNRYYEANKSNTVKSHSDEYSSDSGENLLEQFS